MYYSRVEKLGGKVEVSAQTGWVPRVQGHLAVSRSLGDIRLKEPVTFVSAEPEYSEYVLGPNDQFFLIASDGIWDVMHNQVRALFDTLTCSLTCQSFAASR